MFQEDIIICPVQKTFPILTRWVCNLFFRNLTFQLRDYLNRRQKDIKIRLNNKKSFFLFQSPSVTSTTVNDCTLISLLLHQLTSPSHSIWVNWQVTKICSRNLSVSPQKEQAEEFILPNIFKCTLVTRYLLKILY